MCFNAGCNFVLEEDSHWGHYIVSLKADNIFYYFPLLFGYWGNFFGIYALHLYEFIKLRKLLQTWGKLLLDYLFFSMQLETGH